MDTLNADRRPIVVVTIAAAAVIGMALVYAFSAQLGDTILRPAIDLGDVLAAGICVALCFLLWRAFERPEVLKRVWLYLGIGLGMWTLAEVIYAVYELILQQETPSPSLADLLWVPGYIPIFMALWLRFRSLRVRLSRSQVTLLVAAFVILAALSLTYVIVPNLPETSAGQMISEVMQPSSPQAGAEAFSELGNLALGVLYGLGDLLLAVGVGLTIMVLLGGQLSRSWMIIALGALAIALGDSMYYSGIPSGLYSGDIPINLFTSISDVSYFAGYVLMGLGLYDQARLQRAV
jgi:hypothetical protein